MVAVPCDNGGSALVMINVKAPLSKDEITGYIQMRFAQSQRLQELQVQPSGRTGHLVSFVFHLCDEVDHDIVQRHFSRFVAQLKRFMQRRVPPLYREQLEIKQVIPVTYGVCARGY